MRVRVRIGVRARARVRVRGRGRNRGRRAAVPATESRRTKKEICVERPG